MILVLKPNPAPQKVQELLDSFHAKGFATNVSEGTQHTIIGLIGDTSRLDADYIATIDIVESAKRISEPYKAVNRKIHPQDTHVTAGDVTIGEGLFQVIAGPCSVESEEQIIRVARSVKASGATLLPGGNQKVILCERGVRTFETMTRNTLDISAIPLLKRLTHLPVIVDPSHATGHAWLVPPLARTVVAAGADGLMVEVHNDPANALCDGAQSLDLPQFAAMMEDLKKRVTFEGKNFR